MTEVQEIQPAAINAESDTVLGEILLPLEPTKARCARQFVGAVMRAWFGEPPSEFADEAETSVSELATNAIRYAANSSDATMRLRICWCAHSLRFEVYDPSPTLPAFVRAAPTAQKGRGLALVRGLAEERGGGLSWYRTTYGKCVFFEFSWHHARRTMS